jgi:GDP-L-fucose synthase
MEPTVASCVIVLFCIYPVIVMNSKKLVITGSSGLVGSAIREIAPKYPQYTFVFLTSSDCDLTDYVATRDCFMRERPAIVIHLAARVGGLYKNMEYPVEMFEHNIMMNHNVVKCCYEANVSQMICLLSTCIFPEAGNLRFPCLNASRLYATLSQDPSLAREGGFARDTNAKRLSGGSQGGPLLAETMLHDGSPHPSNFAYAYAKRMMEVQCRAYNSQYNTNYSCIIPTNIYGANDYYSLEDGHVIPALIHKCYLAKQNQVPFEVRGSGSPLRQFLFSRDLAEVLMLSIGRLFRDIVIVSPDAEYTIREVATMIARDFDYEHNVVFNSSFADGQYKKTASTAKFKSLFPEIAMTTLEDGLRESVKFVRDNYDTIRK